MKVIGFSGIEGSGKDTAAAYARAWADERGLSTERQGFADLLKLSAALALGMTREEADYNQGEGALNFANSLKERGTVTITIPHTDQEREAVEAGFDVPESVTLSGRQFLRLYGTEAHRDVFGPEFWTNALFDAYPVWGGNLPDLLLIPDVRFDNEANAINRTGGIVLEVHRPGVKAVGSHVSESGISDNLLKCSIRNDTDLDGLRQGVYTVLDALVGDDV